MEALLDHPLLGGVDYEEVEEDPDLLDEPVLQLDMQVRVWCGMQLASTCEIYYCIVLFPCLAN